MRKLVGNAMIAAPFVVLFGVGWWLVGFLPVVGLYVGLAVFVWWIGKGVRLSMGRAE